MPSTDTLTDDPLPDNRVIDLCETCHLLDDEKSVEEAQFITPDRNSLSRMHNTLHEAICVPSFLSMCPDVDAQVSQDLTASTQ